MAISCTGGSFAGLSTVSVSPAQRGDAIRDRRRGGDQAQAELALEALADDLHVQQAEKAAAEAEAQRHRVLGLVGERRVVERSFSTASRSGVVLRRVGGIEAAEHHRLDRLEAGQRLRRRDAPRR